MSKAPDDFEILFENLEHAMIVAKLQGLTLVVEILKMAILETQHQCDARMVEISPPTATE